jgi:hypothetical protein
VSDTLFDEDGYPLEATLITIENWDCVGRKNRVAFMEYIQTVWWAADWGFHRPKSDQGFWRLSTGGWSGNEDIIRAMRMNYLFWSLCFVQERRGGHYTFDLYAGG